MPEFIRPLNDWLFFLVNNGLHSSVGDLIIGNATYLGNGWITYSIAIMALVAIDRKHFKRNFLVLLAAGIGEGILIQLAKHTLSTPRPLTVFRSAIESGSVHINVMFDPWYSNSFPSGHTQTAFCVAAVVAWATARSSIGRVPSILISVSVFSLAALVGVSRMYVGAHFPVDVLGGFLFGTVPVFVLTWYLDRKPDTSPQLSPIVTPLGEK